MVEVVGLDPTVADLQSLTTSHYITIICTTILVYDFSLTFPAEVERFWIAGRLNCAICLFYLIRYIVLFGYIPIILIKNFWATHLPAKLHYFSTVVQVIIAIMLIMRIYALYKRDIRVLVFLVTVSVILLVVGCWAAFGGKQQANQDVLVYIGCGVSISHDRAIRIAASWTSMFFFDLLVFSMTLYKILTLSRRHNVNVLTIFMRDGAMYFGAVTAATLVNILCLVLGQPLARDAGMTFTNVISSVMISRMMLNLRDPSLVPAPEHTAMEDVPDLTIVESYYPSELSFRGGLEDHDSSQDGVHHRSERNDIELHRIDV